MKKSVFIVLCLCVTVFSCNKQDLYDSNEDHNQEVQFRTDIFTKPPDGNGGGGSSSDCDNETINGNCFGGNFSITHDVFNDCENKIIITGGYQSASNNNFSVAPLNYSVQGNNLSGNGGNSISVTSLNYTSTGNGFINIQVFYTITSTLPGGPFDPPNQVTTYENETFSFDPCN